MHPDFSIQKLRELWQCRPPLLSQDKQTLEECCQRTPQRYSPRVLLTPVDSALIARKLTCLQPSRQFDAPSTQAYCNPMQAESSLMACKNVNEASIVVTAAGGLNGLKPYWKCPGHLQWQTCCVSSVSFGGSICGISSIFAFKGPVAETRVGKHIVQAGVADLFAISWHVLHHPPDQAKRGWGACSAVQCSVCRRDTMRIITGV